LDLDKLLTQFYLGIRTIDGNQFKSSSLSTMRQSLRRVISEKRNMDILNHPDFAKSNKAFSNYILELKQNGKGLVNHHEDINKSDITLIIQNLDTSNPDHLQKLVWFYVMYFFARRGGENLHDLKKDFFKIHINDVNKKYLKPQDELIKNHRSTENSNSHSKGSMYETGTQTWIKWFTCLPNYKN